MSKNYDEEYSLVEQDVDDPKVPFLKPDENSSSRRFLREGPLAGSPPMVFFNAFKKKNIKSGIVADTTPILFSGFDLVVTSAIREKLLHTTVRNLFMHPAVYIDDKDNWHEDYWYLTFSQEIDCWDREKSRYNKNSPVDVGNERIFEVASFRLDEKVLDSIPLEDRLIFKMGGVLNPVILVHKTVRSIFGAGGNAGALVRQVSER